MTLDRITRDCEGRPILNTPGNLETDQGSYTAARWVAELPTVDWHADLFIIHGYAAGIAGPDRGQRWFFFEHLEPALAFGRAARMSRNITGYGVYRAAEETQYSRGNGDLHYLWLQHGSLDRRDDEIADLRRWLDGVDRGSAHWYPEQAGLPAGEPDPELPLLGHRYPLRTASVPAQMRRLPDGRSISAVINTLNADLDGTVSVSAATGEHWGTVSADPIGLPDWKIPAPLASVLDRMTWHAGGRMWAGGYQGAVSGGGDGGPISYWYASCSKADTIAVLLAALELLATGSSAIADWYLASTCKGLCHLHEDRTVPVCPSRWCGLAATGSKCTCRCGGINHATGSQGIPAGKLTLDWASMPCPSAETV